jgi:hypothetical protein
VPVGEVAPHRRPAQGDAVLQHTRQRSGVDAIEHLGVPLVERQPLADGKPRIDALGPGQAQRRARALPRVAGQRQDAAERFAVVAEAHGAVALVGLEVDAIAGGDLEMRRQRGLGAARRAGRRRGRRGALRQAIGEAADRVERFGAGRAAHLVGGRGLQPGGGEADAERLGARRLADEAYDRHQRGGVGGAERDAADPARVDEAAALAPVVPDLQVIDALGADLEHLALPEQRLLRRRLLRPGAQRGLVANDDRERGRRRGRRSRRQRSRRRPARDDRSRRGGEHRDDDGDRGAAPAPACERAAAPRAHRPSPALSAPRAAACCRAASSRASSTASRR